MLSIPEVIRKSMRRLKRSLKLSKRPSKMLALKRSFKTPQRC